MIKLLTILLTLIFSPLLPGQNGVVKTYFSSGKVESRTSFVNNILEGKAIHYFDNGNKKSEKNFSGGKLNGASREFYKSGLLKSEIYFNNGILDGVSRYFYENGGLKEVLDYNLGRLVSNKEISYDSNYIATLKEYEAGKQKRNFENNDFLCEVDVCPEPVGGIEEIEDNIIYPLLARQYKLEGQVLLTAKINDRGIVESVKIVKGLGLGCDEAAIDAVKNTKFIPGEQNGEIVPSEVTFKLNFKINEPKEPADPTLYAIDKDISQENINTNDTVSTKDFITCKLKVCPKPIGGIVELLKKLRYPPQAKRKKISGDVLIEATIDEFGFVTAAKVLKGIGYGCDEAAISALIKTQFKPAQKDGKVVNSIIKINVPFIIK